MFRGLTNPKYVVGRKPFVGRLICCDMVSLMVFGLLLNTSVIWIRVRLSICGSGPQLRTRPTPVSTMCLSGSKATRIEALMTQTRAPCCDRPTKRSSEFGFENAPVNCPFASINCLSAEFVLQNAPHTFRPSYAWITMVLRG